MKHKPLQIAQTEPTGPEFVDPVCGMTVAADSPHRFRHAGVEYRFCCDGCVKKFSDDPSRFLEKRPSRLA